MKNKNNLIAGIILLILILVIALFAIFMQKKENKITDKSYLSKDTEYCKELIIECSEGYRYFNDKTGCGCLVMQINNFEDCVMAGGDIMESLPAKCRINDKVFAQIIDDENGRNYVSDDLEQCKLIRYKCSDGEIAFNDEKGCGCAKVNNLDLSYAEKFTQKAIEKSVAIPVEGFDPDLYKGVFLGLEDVDFDGTKAIGGVWSYDGGELRYIRNVSEGITSADGTLTNEGIMKLIANLAVKNNMILKDEEDFDKLIEIISKAKEIYCDEESRNAQACTMDYNPVCGWFNPEKIQCIKYPCAQTFSNGCGACINKDVLYWTKGECPN